MIQRQIEHTWLPQNTLVQCGWGWSVHACMLAVGQVNVGDHVFESQCDFSIEGSHVFGVCQSSVESHLWSLCEDRRINIRKCICSDQPSQNRETISVI